MESSWTQRTLIACLAESLRDAPEFVAQIVPATKKRPAESKTNQQLWDEICHVAWALSQRGLKSGDNVLFLSENNPHWLTLDLALQGLGCAMAPRGAAAPAPEVEYMLKKVRAPILILENASILKRLPEDLGEVQWILALAGDSQQQTSQCPVVFLAELLATDQPAADWFDEQIRQRQPNQPATIVFTSGTTGQPKGVVLTHANLASNLLQVLGAIDFLKNGGCYTSILPTWHMFERIVEYALLRKSFNIVYSERRFFAAHLRQYQPSVLAAVPRLWILLMDGVMQQLNKASAVRRKLFLTSLAISRSFVLGKRTVTGRDPVFPGETKIQRYQRLARGAVRCAWAPLYALAYPLILRKVAVALGISKLARGAGISGGGSLPEHVDLFFESIGVPLLNGYGLTETSPVLTFRLPGHNVSKTVGQAVAQTQLEIREIEQGHALALGEQGVVHARGPQIMTGYFEEPEATRQVLSEEGWFNTGDLGRITKTSDLMITGRAKDTIVLLSGENIDPEPLENALTASPNIDQAMIVGQDQKYLCALIVPHSQTSTNHQNNSNDALAVVLRQQIDDAINSRNGFRSHERIVRFHVLNEPFSVENGSLSQTLKITRQVVHDQHSKLIESLFQQ